VVQLSRRQQTAAGRQRSLDVLPVTGA